MWSREHGRAVRRVGACSAACGCVQCSMMVVEHQGTSTTSPPPVLMAKVGGTPVRCCASCLSSTGLTSEEKSGSTPLCRMQCTSSHEWLQLRERVRAEEDMCLQLRACVRAVRLFWFTYSFFDGVHFVCSSSLPLCMKCNLFHVFQNSLD